jgi:hypothetical protein
MRGWSDLLHYCMEMVLSGRARKPQEDQELGVRKKYAYVDVVKTERSRRFPDSAAWRT